MAYQKTQWNDHVVSNPSKYTITNNPDGSVTITPQPGAIIQQGTPLSSTNLNKIEDALEAAYNISEANVETVKNITKNVIGLALEVETLKNANLSGIDANIFIEQFITLDDVDLVNGKYDSVSSKIYI